MQGLCGPYWIAAPYSLSSSTHIQPSGTLVARWMVLFPQTAQCSSMGIFPSSFMEHVRWKSRETLQPLTTPHCLHVASHWTVSDCRMGSFILNHHEPVKMLGSPSFQCLCTCDVRQLLATYLTAIPPVAAGWLLGNYKKSTFQSYGFGFFHTSILRHALAMMLRLGYGRSLPTIMVPCGAEDTSSPLARLPLMRHLQPSGQRGPPSTSTIIFLAHLEHLTLPLPGSP